MSHSLTRRRFTRAGVALSLAGLFAASGCSTEADKALSGGPSGTGSGGTKTLRVANLPIADQGAYFYALENGIFDKHGLSIKKTQTTGGSAAIAAMIAGEYDIAYSGADGAIKAAANKLPVKIVSGANTNQPTGEKDSTGLVVSPGVSDIAALSGATIGTNALGNINQVYAQEFLARAGVTNVTVVEVPFPEQVAALQSGKIKASILPEPFASQAVANGSKILGWPYRIGENKTTGVGVFVAVESAIKDKKAEIASFVQAMTEANEAANKPENHEKVVKAILSNTKLESKVASSMVFVNFTTDVTAPQVQTTADLLVKYGVLKTAVDVKPMFANSQ